MAGDIDILVNYALLLERIYDPDHLAVAFEGVLEIVSRGGAVEADGVAVVIVDRIEFFAFESLFLEVSEMEKILVKSDFERERDADYRNCGNKRNENLPAVKTDAVETVDEADDLFILLGVAFLEEMRQED